MGAAMMTPLRLFSAIAISLVLASLADAQRINAMARFGSDGTKGWSDGFGGFHESPGQACAAQWAGVGMNSFPGGLLLPPTPRTPVSHNPVPTYNCNWRSFQYICGDLGGSINYCGTILPSTTSLTCELGYTFSPVGYCVPVDQLIPERAECSSNNGAALNPSVGNPIILGTGAKTYHAVDFATDDGLFVIARHYRSLPIGRSRAYQYTPLGLPKAWAFNFAYELHLLPFSGSPSSPTARLAIVSPQGYAYDFRLTSTGEWEPWTTSGSSYDAVGVELEFVGALPADLSDVHDSVSTWRFTDEQGKTVTFDTFPLPNTTDYRVARPTSIERQSGYTWTLAYNADDTLASITDSFGRQATFAWNYYYLVSGSLSYAEPEPEAVSEITFPDGTGVEYAYDPAASTSAPSTTTIERLVGVERVDALGAVIDSTTYHYEDVRFGWHLTGVTGHRNQRVATYAYDGEGRAISTEGAAGENRFTVAYSTTASGVRRRVVNPLGKASNFDFDQFGTGANDLRLVGVDGEASTNCPASSTSMTYASNGLLATTVDAEARTTSYTRDVAGRPTQIVEAFGTPLARTTDITWHSTHNAPTRIETAELRTDFTYDIQGRLDQVSLVDQTAHTTPYVTAGRVRTWDYSYNTAGLVTAIDGPLTGAGDTVAYTYDASGYLATVTNQVGHVTTITSVDGRGAPLSMTDPNGVITTFAYDAMGRVEEVIIDPGPAQSRYQLTYTLAGDIERLTAPGGAWIDYGYDANRRVVSATNDRGEVVRYTYNAASGVTSVEIEDSLAATLFLRSFEFDELGRVIESIGAGAQSTGFGYDKVSNLVTVNDGRSQTFTAAFDALDRVITDTNPDLQTQSFEYDSANNLTRFEDARTIVTTRKVDGFGHVIEENSPDRGLRTYWYDAAGRLIRARDGGLVEREFTYDDAGRQLTMTFASAPAENVTLSYDDISGGNVGLGRLTRVDDQTGSTTFRYDAQGRPVQRVKTIGANSYMTDYQYDANGAQTRLTLPSGREVFYDRASDGRLTGIRMRPGSSGTPTPVVSNLVWRAGSGLTQMDYANGQSLTRSYDNNGWLTDIIVDNGGPAILDLSFTRDGTGALTYQSDLLIPDRRSAGFGYTNSGRLDWANGPWGDRGFTYDANGNRTETRIVVGGGPADFEFAIVDTTTNRVDEVRDTGWALIREFFYGANGELVREDRGADTYRYFYNTSGRLVQVELNGVAVGDYGYDAFGHRVWRDVNGGATASLDYVFDGMGRLLSLHEASTGAVAREYIWLGYDLVAIVDYSGPLPETYYVHTGQVHEVLAVTDATGATVLESYMQPYGLQGILSGAYSLDLRLPGQWAQSETGGLYQNWFRDYDPQLGRYVQTDPLGLAAGPNVYAYVGANPLNAIDPTGLDCVATGNTVHCNHPDSDVPNVSFPRPDNWPDRISPDDQPLRYHGYDYPYPWPGNGGAAAAAMIEGAAIGNPTPGREDDPATSSGTWNDVGRIAFQCYNPVMSYVMPNPRDPSRLMIVNVTLPGHELFPGYIVQFVDVDPLTGGTTLHVAGEGAHINQSNYNFIARYMERGIWMTQRNQYWGATYNQHEGYGAPQ